MRNVYAIIPPAHLWAKTTRLLLILHSYQLARLSQKNLIIFTKVNTANQHLFTVMKKNAFFSLVLGILGTLGTFVSCKKTCDNDGMGSGKDSCTYDLKKGLLAYYPFNGNFNDASGNGNNGTAMNGASLTTDFLGRTNQAAGFDGVNDYIIVPGSSKLDADSITVSLQVMVNNSNRRNVTVSRVNYTNGASLWGIHESQPTDNKFGWGVAPGTDDCSIAYSYDPTGTTYGNPPIQPGRWYNITATFGGSMQKIYVDGVLQSSQKRSFQNAKKCPGANLMIGGWWASDIVSIDGKLDEVRLYNRVLTDCEISKLAETFMQ